MYRCFTHLYRCLISFWEGPCWGGPCPMTQVSHLTLHFTTHLLPCNTTWHCPFQSITTSHRARSYRSASRHVRITPHAFISPHAATYLHHNMPRCHATTKHGLTRPAFKSSIWKNGPSPWDWNFPRASWSEDKQLFQDSRPSIGSSANWKHENWPHNGCCSTGRVCHVTGFSGETPYREMRGYNTPSEKALRTSSLHLRSHRANMRLSLMCGFCCWPGRLRHPYMYMCVCIYIYIYIYTERERDR